MKILSKNGNELVMLAMKTEIASKGDYLIIEDEKARRKMVVQIYDEEVPFLSVFNRRYCKG